MKHLDLGRLLNKETLAALVIDIETLIGQDITLSLYDAEGTALVGPAVLPKDELQTALQVAKEDAIQEPDPSPGSPIRTLVIEDELAGLLVGARDGPSGEEDDPLFYLQLDAAADLVTLVVTRALENRALAQETLERYREVNLLYRVQESIGARLDLDQIADLVVKESIRVIKASAGALLLLTANQLAFKIQARHGEAPVEGQCAHYDTVAGWVVRNQRPVIANDTATDPRCGVVDKKTQSLLCVPLTIRDKSIGAFTLYEKADGDIFTASDQKLLAALASQAAVAIETTHAVAARENRLKAQIHDLRIEIDEMRKRKQVTSITATEYFARLQRNAQQMRREFEEGL